MEHVNNTVISLSKRDGFFGGVPGGNLKSFQNGAAVFDLNIPSFSGFKPEIVVLKRKVLSVSRRFQGRLERRKMPCVFNPYKKAFIIPAVFF
jgi:hypothetical protein